VQRTALALLFAASVGGTIYLCSSMGGGMQMPGGWTMSMAWMRMPGQTWLGAAATFMAMWVVMMMAMMTPSLIPTLSASRVGAVTLTAAYFLVWTLLGAVLYPLGVLIATAEMRWPALARWVPAATGVVLLLAGCIQLTGWKARKLDRCREVCGPDPWRHGLRLGINCVYCCTSFMTVLLVTGVMNLMAMFAVASAITIERLAPRPEGVARAFGVALIAAGAFVTLRSG
jgi:predicted metal-binding membrane protein